MNLEICQTRKTFLFWSSRNWLKGIFHWVNIIFIIHTIHTAGILMWADSSWEVFFKYSILKITLGSLLLKDSKPGFKTRPWEPRPFFPPLCRPVGVCLNGKLFHHNPWTRVEKQSARSHYLIFVRGTNCLTGCLRSWRAGTEPLAWQEILWTNNPG